jgi:hypothetical protein
MRFPVSHDRAGSVLPAVMIGLAALGLLALGGFRSATFGSAAARAAAGAAAALHAADSGLELYEGGAGPAFGAQALVASPGRGAIVAEPLLRLSDSSYIVRVRAEGAAPVVGPPVRRRSLARLFRLDGSTRSVVKGSWRERI